MYNILERKVADIEWAIETLRAKKDQVIKDLRMDKEHFERGLTKKKRHWRRKMLPWRKGCWLQVAAGEEHADSRGAETKIGELRAEIAELRGN